MLDNKGRLFGKVSLVDLFIVVVVSAVIALVYFNIGASGRHIGGAEQTVLITFYNPALHDFSVEALRENTPVINDANETYLGEVVDIKVGESVSYMPDINGVEAASVKDGYSSVYITSRVKGRVSDGAVVLGGNVYGVGEEIIIWAGRTKTMLHISDIRTEDNQ